MRRVIHPRLHPARCLHTLRARAVEDAARREPTEAAEGGTAEGGAIWHLGEVKRLDHPRHLRVAVCFRRLRRRLCRRRRRVRLRELLCGASSPTHTSPTECPCRDRLCCAPTRLTACVASAPPAPSTTRRVGRLWVSRGGMAGRLRSLTASPHGWCVLQPQPLHTGASKPWSRRETQARGTPRTSWRVIAGC